MLSLFACICVSLGIFGQNNTSKRDDCFSEANFELVYAYIDAQMKKANLIAYQYKGYAITLKDAETITFDKQGVISKVKKDKGIFALPIYKPNNKKAVKNTNSIFCELVAIASK